MEQKTGKQIVSKGRYAVNLGSKLALTSFGVIVFLIGGFCFVCTCGLFGMGLVRFKWSELPLLVFIILFMGGLSVALLYFGVGAVKEAKETDSGLPLTRSNTADLPGADSLVRASSEPVQVQQTILLRAASEGSQTPSEELVRAVNGQE